MDADEIRALLGDNIFERAKKYRKRIQQSTCTVNEDGVRHISAMVQGSGGSYYYTQAWLRENGSFVSASCSCPYNQNGEGTYCKHIGALLLDDAEKNAPTPAAKPDAIPGVVRGVAGLAPEPARRDSYASGLEMLFGKKWHGEAPVSDHEARRLLDTYKEAGADPAARRAAMAAAAHFGRRAAVRGQKHPGSFGEHRTRPQRQLRKGAGLCAPVGCL